VKTHKEKVEELNKYLSNLSEHHDMYVPSRYLSVLLERDANSLFAVGRELDLDNAEYTGRRRRLVGLRGGRWYWELCGAQDCVRRHIRGRVGLTYLMELFSPREEAFSSHYQSDPTHFRL
jgi:hypothetical protein